MIDKDLGKVIMDLIDVIKIKKELMAKLTPIENESLNNYLKLNVLYNKVKIEDIGLNFVIPGYNHIELKENGENIILDATNLEEYINLILDALCYDGIKASIDAFKKGFCVVFPITSLTCFSSDELCDILSGKENENWDYETLSGAIVPNHGYDKNSY